METPGVAGGLSEGAEGRGIPVPESANVHNDQLRHGTRSAEAYSGTGGVAR